MKRRTFIGAAALSAAALVAPAARAANARVVIVGGGFGGSACALLLKRADPSLDVTLIDPAERYVTCPMSNEVVVGARTIDTLTLTREGLRRAGVRFVRARATALDAERRTLRLEDGSRLAYDRCVVAPGIRFLWGTPEGYDEAASERMPHAWEAGAQTTRLADRLRAMDDGGVFAISVPSGLMRCPPGPYERASLVAEFLQRHKPRSKVLIFDANNRFPRQETFVAAWEAQYRGLIEWIPVDAGRRGATRRCAHQHVAHIERRASRRARECDSAAGARTLRSGRGARQRSWVVSGRSGDFRVDERCARPRDRRRLHRRRDAEGRIGRIEPCASMRGGDRRGARRPRGAGAAAR